MVWDITAHCSRGTLFHGSKYFIVPAVATVSEIWVERKPPCQVCTILDEGNQGLLVYGSTSVHVRR